MCGIAGFTSTPDAAPNAERVSRSLTHRGPEDSGAWSTQTGDLTLTLIHRRLRIIDLSPAGHQPMKRGAYTIVFNGEIYNFLDLRRVLEEDGYTFSSSCDTEVILAAYSRWGADCVRRLHGMFAFALWDSHEQQLLLARDRLGKKPLFYRIGDHSLAFGSEIKAILQTLQRTPDVDYEALDDYLTYLYIPYPRTIFAGIHQLAPATWMRIKFLRGGLKSESVKYWDPMEIGNYARSSVADSRAQVQDLLAQAVRSRLISDVPLGVLLSGGLDSSSITAMMSRTLTEPTRSFSIGFPGNKAYDEIPYAKLVADHFGAHHEVMEANASCSRHLANIVWHFDQPFGNPTAVLTYILSSLIKKSVTVALTGDGGDELFGGYPRYIGAYLSRIPRVLPRFLRSEVLPRVASALSDDCNGRHQLRRTREFLQDAGMPLIEMYLRWIGYFSRKDRDALYTRDTRARVGEHQSGDFLRGLFAASEGLEPLNRLAYVDIKSFLCCNVLEYADRMSMAHALELRAPFTDHRLVEFCLRLPFNLKFRYAESKWILRRAMEPFLPDKVLRKHKLGFNPPVGAWIGGELRQLSRELLSPDRIRRRGLFRTESVQNIQEQHIQKRRDHSLQIWALMILELWFSMYVEGRSAESVQDEIDAATTVTSAEKGFAVA